MLEQLNPVERAVFLLHEVFAYEHADIAPVVDRSVENAARSPAGPAAASLPTDRPGTTPVRTRSSAWCSPPPLRRDGQPTIVATVAGGAVMTVTLELAPGGIRRIYGVLAPDELRRLVDAEGCGPTGS